MSRRGRIAGGVAAVGVAAGLAIGGPMALGAARVGAGYAAKNLCSGVFVSARPADEVARDVPDNPMVPLMRADVDRGRGRVTASVAGLGDRVAVHVDGLGCILLPAGSDSLGFAPGTAPDGDPAGAAGGDAARGTTNEGGAGFGTAPGTTNGDADVAGFDASRGASSADAAGFDAPRGAGNENPPGFDTRRLETAIARAFAEPDPERPVNTRAVVVVHRGQTVAERYAPGITPDTPLIGWSMAKSATNALAGVLVREGRLSLADTALFPGWPPGDPRNAITVDDLLRMSSGLDFTEDYGGLWSDVVQMLFIQPDMGAFAGDQPLAAEPGSVWEYSSGTANLLSLVIRRTFADEDQYLAFPRRALFEPLGMRTAVLEPDASGTFVGSSFMYASARDWARLGQLYLDDGVWRGDRILPEGWVAYTATPAPAAPAGQYGAHFWLNAGEGDNGAGRPYPELPRDALFMLGHDGQSVAIFPSHDLVVVRLGFSQYGNWDEVGFWREVVAAFEPAAE